MGPHHITRVICLFAFVYFAEDPLLGSSVVSQCHAHGVEAFRDAPYVVSTCLELIAFPR